MDRNDTSPSTGLSTITETLKSAVRLGGFFLRRWCPGVHFSRLLTFLGTAARFRGFFFEPHSQRGSARASAAFCSRSSRRRRLRRSIPPEHPADPTVVEPRQSTVVHGVTQSTPCGVGVTNDTAAMDVWSVTLIGPQIWKSFLVVTVHPDCVTGVYPVSGAADSD